MRIFVGDLVRLNSGGAIMTVQAISDSGHVECRWFDQNDSLHHCRFHPQTLVLLSRNAKVGGTGAHAIQ